MVHFSLAMKTTNPLNGSVGNSRTAGIIRSHNRKKQRAAFGLLTRVNAKGVTLPVHVIVTRVAPSNGLDPHDGLGAALKGCIDGIADGLGIHNDRDERVKWELRQRRGRPGEYAVEVTIADGEEA